MREANQCTTAREKLAEQSNSVSCMLIDSKIESCIAACRLGDRKRIRREEIAMFLRVRDLLCRARRRNCEKSQRLWRRRETRTTTSKLKHERREERVDLFHFPAIFQPNCNTKHSHQHLTNTNTRRRCWRRHWRLPFLALRFEKRRRWWVQKSTTRSNMKVSQRLQLARIL